MIIFGATLSHFEVRVLESRVCCNILNLRWHHDGTIIDGVWQRQQVGRQVTHISMHPECSHVSDYDFEVWQQSANRVCLCCFTVAAFVKGRSGLIDLCSLKGLEKTYPEIIRLGSASRLPPMAPDAFRVMLRASVKSGNLSFTWHSDEELVGILYERAFRTEFGAAVSLVYCGLGWGDAEIRTLVEALKWATEEVVAMRVRSLDVKDNSKVVREPMQLKLLVDRGVDCMNVLAAAVQGGILPGLRDLHVDRKWAEEVATLRLACRERKMKLNFQYV